MTIDYKVITSEYNDGFINESIMTDFQNKVKHLSSSGWKPIGGISVSCNQANTMVLYQAMIKE